MKARKLLTISLILFSCSIKANNLQKTNSNSAPSPNKVPITNLTASNFLEETSRGIVLVDFWAEWCEKCLNNLPLLEQIAQEQVKSAKITRLNVDNYRLFSLDKGIKNLPCILLYKDGKEVARFEGTIDKNKIIKVINDYK